MLTNYFDWVNHSTPLLIIVDAEYYHLIFIESMSVMFFEGHGCGT